MADLVEDTVRWTKRSVQASGMARGTATLLRQDIGFGQKARIRLMNKMEVVG